MIAPNPQLKPNADAVLPSNRTGYADREVTQPPNWHHLVVWDVLFNATTTGLFLAAAVGELCRPDLLRPVAPYAYLIALVVLVMDLFSLVWDLGHKTRFHHMLRVFKLSSPMSLGTWCLTAYSGPLTLICLLEVAVLIDLVPGDAAWVHPVRVTLLVLGLPVAFGSAAYKGVLFSTSSQPGWRDARWLGAYHTASAVMLGVGVLFALAVAVGDSALAALAGPAFGLLLMLQFVPLTLLFIEMRPALAKAYGLANVNGAFAGVAVALWPFAGQALYGSRVALGLAAVALAFGLSYAVRHVVVLLPHKRPGEVH